jgi:hypothetical protein
MITKFFAALMLALVGINAWSLPAEEGVVSTHGGQALVDVAFTGPPPGSYQTFTFEVLSGNVSSFYGFFVGRWLSHFYLPGEPRNTNPIEIDGECYANACDNGGFLELSGSGNLYFGRLFTPPQFPLKICTGPGGVETGDFGYCGVEVFPVGYYLYADVQGTGDIGYRFVLSDPIALAVDEPERLPMMLAGVAGLAWMHRRRTRRQGQHLAEGARPRTLDHASRQFVADAS